MNDNFKKLKRKLMLEFYVRISLVSLAGWLIVSGLIILFTRLFGANFPFYYGILIGAAVGIGAFVALWLTKKPDDTKIALRIDQDFDMHEKVATMVTFQNTDGFMYEKQREDAKEKLGKKDVKKLPFRLALINVPALVFGASLFTASFFTPAVLNQKKDDKKDNKDKINDKTQDIIDDLHEIINNSDAYQTLKAELNQILEDLLGELKDDDDPQSRLHKVTVAENKVRAALDRANTREEIGAAFESVAEKDSALAMLAKAIKKGDTSGVTLALRKLQKDFGSRTTLKGQAISDHLTAIVNTINKGLKVSLEAEVKVSEKDGLYVSLKNLSTKLDAIQKRFAEYLKAPTENKGVPEEQTKSDASEALETAIVEINQSLDAQAANEELADQVIAYMETLIDPLGSGSGGENGSNRDDNKKDDDNKDDNNNGGDNNGDDKKDDGNGDKTDGDGDDDKKDDNSGDDGNGDGNGDGDKKDDSNDGNKGDGKGDDGNTDGSGSGKGDSENNGNNKGDGASGGSGSTSYGSNDKVYTDKGGYSEYGDVIDDSHNSASKDNEKNGDDELGDILEDYFNSLYGNEGGNTTPRP